MASRLSRREFNEDFGTRFPKKKECEARHGLREQTINIFLHKQVHKEALVDLEVKLWESTSCVGVNSSVKHTRVRNTETST
jgi:hypothetical protein